VTWEIIPVQDSVTRFTLQSMIAEAYALAGIPLPPLSREAASPDAPEMPEALREAVAAPQRIAAFCEALAKDAALEAALKEKLDAAWHETGFSGAALTYLWREEVRVALLTQLHATGAPMLIAEASDPLLVLNVLARARSAVLMAGAPVVLEKGFLNRMLTSDDPRLAALVAASGCHHVAVALREKAEDEDDEATA
jgi:hypothetical protein